MSEKTVNIHIMQGETSWQLSVPEVISQRAGEIASRYPIGYWDEKGMDLLRQAAEELRAEGKLPEPEEPLSPYPSETSTPNSETK